jgi:hypothetical protein
MIYENDETATTCELNVDEQILSNHSESFSLPMTKTWETILEKSIKAIVSIKANRVRNFDTVKSG